MQENAKLSMQTVVEHNEDVLFSEVADGMSLMDIESGKYFHFDQTGTQIWKCIEGAMPVSKLCEKLEQEFDVAPETCREDTLEFLEQLNSMELIKTAN